MYDACRKTALCAGQYGPVTDERTVQKKKKEMEGDFPTAG